MSGRTASQAWESSRGGHGAAKSGPGHQPEPFCTARAGEKVHVADEIGDEIARRLLVELFRRALLHNPPLSHQRDAVRHHQCLLLIVRDHDEGNSHDVLKALELDLHLPAQLLVERGERLIQQQHPRALHQGAGQGDPLALAAGELVRAPAFQPVELDHGECVSGPLLEIGSANAVHAQAVGDVVEDAEMGEKGIGLEHHVDRAAVGPDHDQVLAVERNGALVGGLEAREDTQQRRLAASGRPQEGIELVLPDRQRYPVERPRGTEALADAVHLDDRAHSFATGRLMRWEIRIRVKLTNRTIVAMALISGVTPKRIIE